MKLKDIISYIDRPFIVIIPGEKIDNKRAQLLVNIDNSCRVGHVICTITDIYENRPEIMEYNIKKIRAIMHNVPITVIQLSK